MVSKSKIVGEFEVGYIQELSIDYNGSNYLLIYGNHVNGGFFAIINHGISGDLATFDDEFWNAESIGNVLNDFEVGKALARVIAIQEAQ